MDLSELIFTSLGPILYNLIFISLWILWFGYHREEEGQRLKKFFHRYLEDNFRFYIITSIIIVIFLYLLLDYAVLNTDVDNAITSAVEAFLGGQNPYREDVVEHFVDNTIIYGRYHYFPPDLLSYSLFYIFGGFFFIPFLDTYWFVPLHFILLVPSYLITLKIILWPHRRLLPLFLLLVIPFLFTNSILMLFFFLIGYYYYEEKNSYTIGMTFYVLAASVKYMVGFIIIFYFVKDLKKIIEKNLSIKSDFKQIVFQFRPYIISSTVLLMFSLPFGFLDVIISVFIYQGAIPFREEVAQSVGPLLIELLNLVNLQEFYLIAVGFLIIVIYILLRQQPIYDQIMHFSFLAMLILPFYATELFITIPFYWLFKEGYKSYIIKNP